MKETDLIPFTKMSGTGNDFIVFDNRDGRFTGEESSFFAAVCRRRHSVGADGVILADRGASAPVRMRYYNADGGAAAFCANGARCAARFAFEKGFTEEHRFILEASDGNHAMEVLPDTVRLRMAEPVAYTESPEMARDSRFRDAGFINTGVPHLVLFLDDAAALEALDVESEAPFYRRHPAFPGGTNVNFAARTAEGEIRVRTFERGVEGETLSCGTGCTAAALIASRAGRAAAPPVSVRTRGGLLTVDFDPHWRTVVLSGPAVTIFEGVLRPTSWSTGP
ncbi:diaminopimelate epimerase [bacterium]|nr:diaminopimelate epimerase [bacterium]